MSGFHTFFASTLIALIPPKFEPFHIKYGLCHSWKWFENSLVLMKITFKTKIPREISLRLGIWCPLKGSKSWSGAANIMFHLGGSVSSTFQDLVCDGSVITTCTLYQLMRLNHGPINGEHVFIFVTQSVSIATVNAAKNTLTFRCLLFKNSTVKPIFY